MSGILHRPPPIAPKPFSQTPHRFNMFRNTYISRAEKEAASAEEAKLEIDAVPASRALRWDYSGPANAAAQLFGSTLVHTQRLVLAFCAPPLFDAAVKVASRRRWAELLAAVETKHGRQLERALVLVDDGGEKRAVTIAEACAREWLLRLHPSPTFLRDALDAGIKARADGVDDVGSVWSSLAVRKLETLPWAHLVAASQLLQMSKLALARVTTLRSWFIDTAAAEGRPAPRRFELLYRASRDGFAAIDFHSRCDNKGATLTLVRTEAGELVGGFADLSWQSSARGEYLASKRAWVFALCGKYAPVKLSLRKEKKKSCEMKEELNAKKEKKEGKKATVKGTPRALLHHGCVGPLPFFLLLTFSY